MNTPFISGREALLDATRLIDLHGDDAGYAAAELAEKSRGEGNVVRFCHWRQIERVIATLTDPEIRSAIH